MSESKRCKKCGFRVRGKNHASGSHHNGDGRYLALATKRAAIARRQAGAAERRRLDGVSDSTGSFLKKMGQKRGR